MTNEKEDHYKSILSYKILSDSDIEAINTNQEEINSLIKVKDKNNLKKAINTYLQLTSHILKYIVDKKTSDTEKLKSDNKKFPIVIGVTGSVAVGKSTFSKILQFLIPKLSSFGFKSVELVATDGFLFSNSVLEKKGLMESKGFPESYNKELFYEFMSAISSGVNQTEAPIYSHEIYDILENEKKLISSPDILIIEGVNLFLNEKAKDNLFDFLIYIDAKEQIIRQWYIERFLGLRHQALNDKKSFFNRFSSFSEAETKDIASNVWEKINLKNLNDNILPTRNFATMIISKSEDHMVEESLLRNI
ncbi:MAG: type I pantothenate kinase [Pseudomonadota bacterium]|nr:type I pantothenate kinase [Pseudomonadota bacterium]